MQQPKLKTFQNTSTTFTNTSGFSNLSGAVRSMVVQIITINPATGGLSRANTAFVSGKDSGTININDAGHFINLNDTVVFNGTKSAQLNIFGTILRPAGSAIATGSATFNLLIPAVPPINGKQTVVIGGASIIAVPVKSAATGVYDRITLRAAFQPSSVTFNSYSSGAFTKLSSMVGDARITLPVMVKTIQ
ncbi:MAG: hypothetical protein ABSG42_02765 [Nitrospirota bacterium]